MVSTVSARLGLTSQAKVYNQLRVNAIKLIHINQFEEDEI